MNEVVNHYDRLIEEGNDPVYDPAPLREYMDKWDGETFIDKMQLNDRKTILEIGVGTGRLAIRTAPICKSLIGIDISSKTIERAKKNLLFNNITLICADFLEHTFAMQFDVIYSSLTFMHFEDKLYTIRKVASLLNNDGVFLLSFDKNQDEYINFGSRKIRIYPDSPDKIRYYLTSVGLIIDDEYETDHAYIFISRKGKS